jgi:hypothetical protein
MVCVIDAVMVLVVNLVMLCITVNIMIMQEDNSQGSETEGQKTVTLAQHNGGYHPIRPGSNARNPCICHG